jgi:hypothetical protein
MGMYVVMVASECAPVAKAGGLADVVFGLSRELEIRGHEVAAGRTRDAVKPAFPPSAHAGGRGPGDPPPFRGG